MKPPINPNYCATVTQLGRFVTLANCANVKGALIFGNQVIVGNETAPGDIGLFFPLESALSAPFLRANNLYRKPELNADTNVKGYFEDHGRVRAVKFRGHKSEGFWIPLTALNYLAMNVPEEEWLDLRVGANFDEFGGNPI